MWKMRPALLSGCISASMSGDFSLRHQYRMSRAFPLTSRVVDLQSCREGWLAGAKAAAGRGGDSRAAGLFEQKVHS